MTSILKAGAALTLLIKLSDKRDDSTLFQKDSPEACVGGKNFGGHEPTNYADWDTDMDPNAAQQFIAHPSDWGGKKTLRFY